MPARSEHRVYRYYDFVMAGFVTILLCSDLIGTSKICEWHGFTFGAAIFFFPISYIFGDILTEVYGYARARKVVWAGFGALFFASLMSWIVIRMPPSPHYLSQGALESIFGNTPRLVAASLFAYFIGEFCNSFIMAKMKLLTRGRWLWTRTVGSTIGGEFVDSVLFYPLAFYGIWPNEILVKVTITNFCLKVSWEILMTPLTYKVVNFLKRAEQEDYYDWDTDFTPFSLKT